MKASSVHLINVSLIILVHIRFGIRDWPVPQTGVVGDVVLPADQGGGKAVPGVAAEGDVVALHHLDPGLRVRVPHVPRLDADPGVGDHAHLHRHELLHAVKVLVVIDQTHPQPVIFPRNLKKYKTILQILLCIHNPFLRCETWEG